MNTEKRDSQSLKETVVNLEEKIRQLSLELKCKSEKLEETEQRLLKTQKMTSLGNWELNLDTDKLYWSDEIFNIFEIDKTKFGATYEAFLEAIHPDDREKVNNAYSTSLENKLPYEITHRLLMPDGRIKFVKECCDTTYNKDGKPIISIGTVQDITENIQKINELNEREIQYKNLANSGLSLLWTSGLDKLCNYFNDTWLKFTGRTLEQEMGNGWAEGVHPEDFDRCLNTYVTAFDKREPFEMEYRLKHHSGEYKWILDLGTPNFNSKNEFVGYIGNCFDIDERKKMEVALNESEEKFRNLFEHSVVGKSITSIDGRLNVNQAFCNIVGYSESELKDRNWKEITHPDDIELNINIVKTLLRGEKDSVRWEKRYIHKKGHIIWTDICTTLQKDKAGNPQYFITAIIDITSQKIIETELKNSREQFKDLFENAPIGYHEIDFEGKVLLMNKTELDLLGYTIDEVKGRYIWEFIQNPTFSKATTSSKLAGTENSVLPYEREFLSKDSRLISILVQDKFLHNAAGKITGIRSTVQDISELKKTEKALKISETRNSSILETAMEGFWRVDKAGKILQVNNSMCQMTGYTTSELLTMSVSDIEATENQEDVERHVKFVQENNFHRFETKHRRKDGQIIDLEVSLQLVNENEGQVVAFFRDITERKKQNMHSERAKKGIGIYCYILKQELLFMLLILLS